MAPDRLLTIGEFSHLTRISVRMLRHYDEHGVLHPTRVDDWTGYRHYSADLLAVAARIRELRDVGLGVAELATVAPLLADPEAVRRVLDGQRARLAEEADRIAARLRLLEALQAELDAPSATTVTLRTVPARTDVALRGTVPRYTDEPVLWERLHAALPTSGARLAEPGLRTATYHDESYVDHDPDVEVGYAVAEPFTATGELRCVRTPQRTVASALLRGPYEQITRVLGDLGRWIAAEGYRMEAPPYVVYLITPDTVPDPAGWLTEVCVPVEEER